MQDHIREMLRSSQCDSLSADEERRLAILSKAGAGDSAAAAADRKAARDKLIMSQLRWAFRLSKRYAKRDSVSFDADDLFQAATTAVLRSVDGFDVNRGTRLSTYVARSVLTECRRYYAKQSRLSAGVQLLENYRSHDDGGGRLTSANKLGTIDDPPEVGMELGEDLARLRRSLDELPFRHREILKMRMAGKRFEEIAKATGSNRQRVHQLERQAIRLLCKMYGTPFNGQSFAAHAWQ